MHHYKFPTITDISQVLDAINGKPEFIVAERPFGTVINYIIHLPTTFNDPDLERQALLRECRGIIFGPKGNVIARRFHKFFNVGEKPETQPDELQWNVAHDIFDKLDGSMITPVPLPDGTFEWGTKMGLTDVAKQAHNWTADYPNYQKFAYKCIDLGITPILEWTSRQQRIVLDYPTDQMTLLAIRENVSGVYWPIMKMWAIASVYKIPLCGFRPGHIQNIREFTEQTANEEGVEGYVIRFVDGHMLKVKTGWYCRIHSAKERLLWEKDVVQMIVREELDDVKTHLMEDDRKRLEEFEAEFHTGLLYTAEQFSYGMEMVRQLYPTKKDYAISDIGMDPRHRRESSLVFWMWDRDDEQLIPHLKDLILRNTGSQSKVDQIRWVWNNAKWLPGVMDDVPDRTED